ncbi:MAG: 2Fe-2S iron-sulfur cluster-binding protein [Polyangiaceae bacterium]
MPVAHLDGLDVRTVEGLPPEDRDLLARSFVAAAGVQCGFCIPGILLRTASLLTRPLKPSRAEIAKALDVHLCRCTGYVKILDAVELAFDSKRSGTLPALVEDGHVGQRLARYEGLALALESARMSMISPSPA